ncbi:hypothetical protein ACO34A_09955 [Rhizobium sp. ACO-34A]|nr:hypothetical protein [Rhizobium sp. ACO-34A]ATN34128.1 hypothetical protein ACO34A_09955 [Rhizobium sp. ACO-34A]
MRKITGNRPKLAAIAVSVTLLASTASAGMLATAAAEAEKKADKSDFVGAFEAMRDAFADFGGLLPLTVGKAVFVTERPKGYGAYKPRKEPVFEPGEPLITYVELIGLNWKREEDGLQHSNFTVDFELIDSKGETLASQKNFGTFSFAGYARNQEMYTHLTLDIDGAAAGAYRLRYTINDTLAQKSTSVEQPFTVVAHR